MRRLQLIVSDKVREENSLARETSLAGVNGDSVPKCWKCSSKCKPVTDSEVSTILKFKSGFAKAVREVRKLLDKCDDCPNHRCHRVE